MYISHTYLSSEVNVRMVSQDSQDTGVPLHGCYDHGRGVPVVLGVQIGTCIDEQLCDLIFITTHNRRIARGEGEKRGKGRESINCAINV